jgi:c-di-AMP phosphodiesterase-like protein
MLKKFIYVFAILIVQLILTFLVSVLSDSSPGNIAMMVGFVTTIFLYWKSAKKQTYTPFEQYQWLRVAGLELNEIHKDFQRKIAIKASLIYSFSGLVVTLYSSQIL